MRWMHHVGIHNNIGLDEASSESALNYLSSVRLDFTQTSTYTYLSLENRIKKQRSQATYQTHYLLGTSIYLLSTSIRLSDIRR